jgi:hypothetical protein
MSAGMLPLELHSGHFLALKGESHDQRSHSAYLRGVFYLAQQENLLSLSWPRLGGSVVLCDDLAADFSTALEQVLKADAFLFERFANFIESLGNDHLCRLDQHW